MEISQHQYVHRLQLLQIRIKKLQDRLEQAKYGRFLRQVENDPHIPPPDHQVPYPKFTKTYFPDTAYKRNSDLINNMQKRRNGEGKERKSSRQYLLICGITIKQK